MRCAPAIPVSVAESVEDYLKASGGRGLSAAHLRGLRSHLGTFAGVFGRQGVASVESAAVLDWLLKRGSAKTVVKILDAKFTGKTGVIKQSGIRCHRLPGDFEAIFL